MRESEYSLWYHNRLKTTLETKIAELAKSLDRKPQDWEAAGSTNVKLFSDRSRTYIAISAHAVGSTPRLFKNHLPQGIEDMLVGMDRIFSEFTKAYNAAEKDKKKDLLAAYSQKLVEHFKEQRSYEQYLINVSIGIEELKHAIASPGHPTEVVIRTLDIVRSVSYADFAALEKVLASDDAAAVSKLFFEKMSKILAPAAEDVFEDLKSLRESLAQRSLAVEADKEQKNKVRTSETLKKLDDIRRLYTKIFPGHALLKLITELRLEKDSVAHTFRKHFDRFFQFAKTNPLSGTSFDMVPALVFADLAKLASAEKTATAKEIEKSEARAAEPSYLRNMDEYLESSARFLGGARFEDAIKCQIESCNKYTIEDFRKFTRLREVDLFFADYDSWQKHLESVIRTWTFVKNEVYLGHDQDYAWFAELRDHFLSLILTHTPYSFEGNQLTYDNNGLSAGVEFLKRKLGEYAELSVYDQVRLLDHFIQIYNDEISNAAIDYKNELLSKSEERRFLGFNLTGLDIEFAPITMRKIEPLRYERPAAGSEKPIALWQTADLKLPLSRKLQILMELAKGEPTKAEIKEKTEQVPATYFAEQLKFTIDSAALFPTIFEKASKVFQADKAFNDKWTSLREESKAKKNGRGHLWDMFDSFSSFQKSGLHRELLSLIDLAKKNDAVERRPGTYQYLLASLSEKTQRDHRNLLTAPIDYEQLEGQILNELVSLLKLDLWDFSSWQKVLGIGEKYAGKHQAQLADWTRMVKLMHVELSKTGSKFAGSTELETEHTLGFLSAHRFKPQMLVSPKTERLLKLSATEDPNAPPYLRLGEEAETAFSKFWNIAQARKTSKDAPIAYDVFRDEREVLPAYDKMVGAMAQMFGRADLDAFAEESADQRNDLYLTVQGKKSLGLEKALTTTEEKEIKRRLDHLTEDSIDDKTITKVTAAREIYVNFRRRAAEAISRFDGQAKQSIFQGRGNGLRELNIFRTFASDLEILVEQAKKEAGHLGWQASPKLLLIPVDPSGVLGIGDEPNALRPVASAEYYVGRAIWNITAIVDDFLYAGPNNPKHIEAILTATDAFYQQAVAKVIQKDLAQNVLSNIDKHLTKVCQLIPKLSVLTSEADFESKPDLKGQMSEMYFDLMASSQEVLKSIMPDSPALGLLEKMTAERTEKNEYLSSAASFGQKAVLFTFAAYGASKLFPGLGRVLSSFALTNRVPAIASVAFGSYFLYDFGHDLYEFSAREQFQDDLAEILFTALDFGSVIGTDISSNFDIEHLRAELRSDRRSKWGWILRSSFLVLSIGQLAPTFKFLGSLGSGVARHLSPSKWLRAQLARVVKARPSASGLSINTLLSQKVVTSETELKALRDLIQGGEEIRAALKARVLDENGFLLISDEGIKKVLLAELTAQRKLVEAAVADNQGLNTWKNSAFYRWLERAGSREIAGSKIFDSSRGSIWKNPDQYLRFLDAVETNLKASKPTWLHVDELITLTTNVPGSVASRHTPHLWSFILPGLKYSHVPVLGANLKKLEKIESVVNSGSQIEKAITAGLLLRWRDKFQDSLARELEILHSQKVLTADLKSPEAKDVIEAMLSKNHILSPRYVWREATTQSKSTVAFVGEDVEFNLANEARELNLIFSTAGITPAKLTKASFEELALALAENRQAKLLELIFSTNGRVQAGYVYGLEEALPRKVEPQAEISASAVPASLRSGEALELGNFLNKSLGRSLPELSFERGLMADSVLQQRLAELVESGAAKNAQVLSEILGRHASLKEILALKRQVLPEGIRDGLNEAWQAALSDAAAFRAAHELALQSGSKQVLRPVVDFYKNLMQDELYLSEKELLDFGQLAFGQKQVADLLGFRASGFFFPEELEVSTRLSVEGQRNLRQLLQDLEALSPGGSDLAVRAVRDRLLFTDKGALRTSAQLKQDLDALQGYEIFVSKKVTISTKIRQLIEKESANSQALSSSIGRRLVPQPKDLEIRLSKIKKALEASGGSQAALQRVELASRMNLALEEVEISEELTRQLIEIQQGLAPKVASQDVLDYFVTRISTGLNQEGTACAAGEIAESLEQLHGLAIASKAEKQVLENLNAFKTLYQSQWRERNLRLAEEMSR